MARLGCSCGAAISKCGSSIAVCKRKTKEIVKVYILEEAI